MTEPDVTLTDYGVALECVLFLILLSRGSGSGRRLWSWLMVFFASASAASVCGGTVHGFFLDQQTLGYRILWPATLLAMGLTALSMWAIGAKLLCSRDVARWIVVAAAGEFILYGVVLLLGSQTFWVGIADNLPAILFLLLALGVTFRRQRQGGLLLAVGGPTLVLIAALLQQLRVGIHPVYFNHNALYHLLQAIAIFLLFLCSRRLLATERRQAGAELREPDLGNSGAANDGPLKAT